MKIFIQFFLLFLVSCQPDSSVTTFTGNKMTMDYKVVIGQFLSDAEVKKVTLILHNAFQEINEIHNKWNPHSEISRLNALPAQEKVPLSKELFSLLQLADKLFHLSDGLFDPTIEPLQQIWRKSLEKGLMPRHEDIQAIKPAIGWEKIHFDENFFWKECNKTRLDLSSIAKGHLVDLLVQRLAKAGYPNTYVEWGGEIRVKGKHPTNRPWQIAIKNIDTLNESPSISLIDQAIATSGDYNQFWECVDQEGKKKQFFHIINPKTFMPLEKSQHNIASASVIASSCAFADGLATCLLLYEKADLAKEWLNKIQSEPIPYCIYSRDSS